MVCSIPFRSGPPTPSTSDARRLRHNAWPSASAHAAALAKRPSWQCATASWSEWYGDGTVAAPPATNFYCHIDAPAIAAIVAPTTTAIAAPTTSAAHSYINDGEPEHRSKFATQLLAPNATASATTTTTTRDATTGSRLWGGSSTTTTTIGQQQQSTIYNDIARLLWAQL